MYLQEITHFIDSIYDDVVPKFDQWKAEGKKIYIYSSGSVPAQKLLVKYSAKGDLSSVGCKLLKEVGVRGRLTCFML
jgi:methionine salvage enolase-phosphatase E1